jgi:50S ribosomal protein L16 3-hydroxylase
LSQSRVNQPLHFPPGLDAERFLRDYWQRQPLLLRQALAEFSCGLSPEELAGLACETQVESRLVLEMAGNSPWEVRQGPFDEAVFTQLPESHWTLLVQDVDKQVPAVAHLLDHFHFLPDWRFDDVMVSFAADQGSVGPHVDDYDVFLYQAKGKRRWQIHSQPVSQDDFIPGLDLRILPRFAAEQEWLLEPGDLLYLPPRIAHWGVAEGECMTCSVGFRAPSHRELVSAWCDELLQQRVSPEPYRDPQFLSPSTGAEIDPVAMAEIHRLLQHSLVSDAEQQRRWFGRFITETKPNLQVAAVPQPLQPLEFLNRYRVSRLLQRNGYTRFAFSRGSTGQDSLFANGKEYLLPSEEADFLPVITRYRQLHFGYLQEWLHQADYLHLVCTLYNDGHFEFPDD